MSDLLALAAAPALICLFYVYIRDKYEKEPWRLTLTGLFFGIIIIVPVIHSENLVTALIPNGGLMMEAFYQSFVVAALVEETYKYIVLVFLIRRNSNFNEPFDGIVYAVFISLGFAGTENILYVFSPSLGGYGTALARAVFSVPGHAFFGVIMGYYFALIKYKTERKIIYYLAAFLAPLFYHGVYDFILLSGMPFMPVVFGLFSAFLWYTGFKRMNRHISDSPFK